jgi:TPR repeat protein
MDKGGAALCEQECSKNIAASCTARGNASQALEEREQYHQKACDLGDAAGCGGLGYAYAKKGDAVRSAQLYEKGCLGGDMLACMNYGTLLSHGGPGVKRDPKRGAELLEKSCNAGVTPACFNLAGALNSGVGVKKDPARARAIYQKLCDGGDRFACDNLREMSR